MYPPGKSTHPMKNIENPQSASHFKRIPKHTKEKILNHNITILSPKTIYQKIYGRLLSFGANASIDTHIDIQCQCYVINAFMT